jgi:hypothetical protein
MGVIVRLFQQGDLALGGHVGVLECPALGQLLAKHLGQLHDPGVATLTSHGGSAEAAGSSSTPRRHTTQ